MVFVFPPSFPRVAALLPPPVSPVGLFLVFVSSGLICWWTLAFCLSFQFLVIINLTFSSYVLPPVCCLPK